MLKLKNKELKNVVSALSDLGNRSADIKAKWEFRKRLTPFFNASSILQEQIGEIIINEGENGILSPLNDTYKKLMECDIDIDANVFTLEELEQYYPSVEHLVMLGPVIKEE